ncbi:MAG: hypothetical protein JW727_05675 [Candidatus Aenigmarchaeota archaeon]|nr:hypothetical protein [Candidatus Aenigmarchaeota archaeon]
MVAEKAGLGGESIIKKAYDGTYGAMVEDFKSYSGLFPGPDAGKFTLGAASLYGYDAFVRDSMLPVIAPIHELMHALTVEATGGDVNYIALEPGLGAEYWKELYAPFTESSNLEGCNGLTGWDATYYPDLSPGLNELANLGQEGLVSVAPYLAATTLGIYLLQEGKSRKSLPIGFLGGALLTENIGGMASRTSDYRQFGEHLYSIVLDKLDALADGIGLGDIPIDVPDTTALGGIVFGLAVLGLVYGVSRKGVNFTRKIAASYKSRKDADASLVPEKQEAGVN